MKNKKIIIPIIALVVIALGVGCFFAIKHFSNNNGSTIGEILGTPQNAELVKVVVSSDVDANPNSIKAEITDAKDLAKFSEILKYEAKFLEENKYDGTTTNLSFYFSDDSTCGFMLAGDTKFKANGNIYSLIDEKLDKPYIESFFAKN